MNTTASKVSPPPGLCGTCQHARVLHSDRATRFFRCNLSDHDRRYARYPALPVVHCQGYQPVVAASSNPESPQNP